MASLPYQSTKSLAGVRHGFFGRRGGVSHGVYSSLNAGTSTGDGIENARENRARAVSALRGDPGSLMLVRQIHSSRAVTVGDGHDPATEADALVTDRPGVTIGILTADCCPVLFADKQAGVVGAAHAGWKGAVGGVLEATVAAMVALGARPETMVAAIGPTISARHYEVGPDFRATVLAAAPEAASFFVSGANQREHFDLPGFVADLLERCGVDRIEPLGLCTYGEPQDYFSHRRATHEGTTTGRQISLIGLG